MDCIRPSFYIMFHHLPIYFPKLNGHNSGVLVPYFQTTPWFTARRFAAKVLPNMRGQTCSPRHRQTSKGMRHVLLLTDCIDNRREADLGATHTHQNHRHTPNRNNFWGPKFWPTRISAADMSCLPGFSGSNSVMIWKRGRSQLWPKA